MHVSLLLYRAVISFVLCQVSYATHFRYGSVRWVPTTNSFEAEFELKAAFRKNYNWGAFFKEKWRDLETSNSWNSDLAITPTYLPCDNSNITNSKILCFDDSAEPYTEQYEILFPAGMGVYGYDLAPNNDSLDAYVYPAGNTTGAVGKILNGAADAENTGGRVCECRFHKGVSSNNVGCTEASSHVGGGVTTTDTGYAFAIAAAQALTSPSFALGQIQSGTGTERISTCTPWSEVFGFFYGDGSWNNEGVVLQVTNIDFNDNLVGNFFRGTSQRFLHQYAAANKDGTGTPYTAFFTGGNRISNLNNNANGRYRLEVAVKFRTGSPENQSPVGGQIPLLPVPYTNAPGALFQVPAYDPDAQDEVRFFLGRQTEHGGLLANPTSSGVYTWHKDVYRRSICQDQTGQHAMCSQVSQSGLSATAAGSYPLDANNPNTLLPDWEDTVNLPFVPQDLTIDYQTGIVRWRTGINMETADSEGYGPRPTGFYNLVVMVEELKPGDTDIAQARDRNAVKVPIDFLIYLYPAMHFCNADCENNLNNILQTMETKDGLYGDSDVGGMYPLSGLGQCKVCGGGGYYLSSNDSVVEIDQDDVVFNPAAYNAGTSYCVVPQIRTNYVAATGETYETCCASPSTQATDVEWGVVSDPGFSRTSNPTGYNFQGCLGSAPQDLSRSIVPYSGTLDTCNINTPPFFLTAATTPQGITPEMEADTEPFVPYRVSYEKGTTVSFTLQAYDPDECSEIEISETGLLPNMVLGPPSRITSLGTEAARSVQRTFTWVPYYTSDTTGTIVQTDNADLDERSMYSVTCFFATDQYLLTSYPYHCVEISLVQPTVVAWCEPASNDGRTFTTYLGDQLCIDLCVQKSPVAGVNYNIDVRAVTEETSIAPDPTNPNFDYPFDSINFPASSSFITMQNPAALQDPYTAQWCVTPEDDEECAYTVCFEGVDMDTFVDDTGSKERTTTRCYRVWIFNTVLLFDEPQDLAEEYTASQLIMPEDGYSMSVWTRPFCGVRTGPAVNETVLMFLSNRSIPEEHGPMIDRGLSIRSAIQWKETAQGNGAFLYFDEHSGDFTSQDFFACDVWHYVAVTVAGNGSSTLYVDGALAQYDLPEEVDLLKFSTKDFVTSSRPDHDSDIDGYPYGFLRIGQDFNGYIDEVRVWNRALSSVEVDRDMFTRRVDVAPHTGVVLALSMKPSSLPQLLTSSTQVPSIAYPGTIPCVLGMDQVVGPAVGGCQVEVLGWSFAKSTHLLCSFGDYQVRAEYISPSSMSCKTPGVITPKFVSVTVSNNGGLFTNTEAVGKDVKFLYMDSVLYMDGSEASGSNVDGICEELLEREQEGDRQITFGGWFCPNCGPPGTI